jgi:hypothetical protein
MSQDKEVTIEMFKYAIKCAKDESIIPEYMIFPDDFLEV